MLVSDILTTKGIQVITISEEESIGQAASILAEHKFGVLVISVDGSIIDGIVSERDIVRGLASEGPPLIDQPISTIMTRNVHTCASTDTVETLMSLMTEKRIRHVPVEVKGKIGGLISIGDVVKARVAELEDEARHLGNYIKGY